MVDHRQEGSLLGLDREPQQKPTKEHKGKTIIKQFVFSKFFSIFATAPKPTVGRSLAAKEPSPAPCSRAAKTAVRKDTKHE